MFFSNNVSKSYKISTNPDLDSPTGLRAPPRARICNSEASHSTVCPIWLLHRCHWFYSSNEQTFQQAISIYIITARTYNFTKNSFCWFCHKVPFIRTILSNSENITANKEGHNLQKSRDSSSVLWRVISRTV